jgi:hypothetical protein
LIYKRLSNRRDVVITAADTATMRVPPDRVRTSTGNLQKKHGRQLIDLNWPDDRLDNSSRDFSPLIRSKSKLNSLAPLCALVCALNGQKSPFFQESYPAWIRTKKRNT